MVSFMRRAHALNRLCMEEAVRREILSNGGQPVLQEAILSMMLSMRAFERSAIPDEGHEWCLYSTLTEVNLRKLGTDVFMERSCISVLPFFAEAWLNEDMRMEIMSLMPMRMQPGAVVMSEAQIRARGEAQGSNFEGRTIVGRLSSVFDGLMHANEV